MVLSVDLIVLNYNGRALLAECLPSVVAAAARSRHRCRVVVIDNSSTDDSLAWLADHHPDVTVITCSNRGLCSYNEVVKDSLAGVVLLLNNDIRLAHDAIDPLVEPLVDDSSSNDCWATAPRAWLFNETTFEGFRTAVGWRWGLVQATAHFNGAEAIASLPGDTASAGAALAVDRAKFIKLGGFDPLYLPGRIEDLDLAYRAHQAGYTMRYVPTSHVWHRGEATFSSELGSATSHQLALRNTLLFQWKHLRSAASIARQGIGIPLRLAIDSVRAPWQPRESRWSFTRALLAALPQFAAARQSTYRGVATRQREASFFARFNVAQLRAQARGVDLAADERRRWTARHPLSQWYMPSLIQFFVQFLSTSKVRPNHITWLGVAFAAVAMLLLVAMPGGAPIAAIFVWLAWFCDRLDGPLARAQQTASHQGAQLDAHVDEAVDLGLHAAVAYYATVQSASLIPCIAGLAFIAGKAFLRQQIEQSSSADDSLVPTLSIWRKFYHLPGNTDIRLHLLLAALVMPSCLTAELLFVAAYYNLRWVLKAMKSQARPRLATARGATP